MPKAVVGVLFLYGIYLNFLYLFYDLICNFSFGLDGRPFLLELFAFQIYRILFACPLRHFLFCFFCTPFYWSLLSQILSLKLYTLYDIIYYFLFYLYCQPLNNQKTGEMDYRNTNPFYDIIRCQEQVETLCRNLTPYDIFQF